MIFPSDTTATALPGTYGSSWRKTASMWQFWAAISTPPTPLSPRGGRPWTKESYTEEGYQLLLKSMREIVDAAEKLGVIVGVEGVFNHTLYSPARMRRFLDDIHSPNVEVILDAVNLIHPDEVSPEAQERVVRQAFAYYGDRISALHVKDFVFEGEEQLFRHVGDGMFHYEPLLRLVKEKKPHIAMLLENSSRDRFHGDAAFLQEIYDRV